MTSDDPRHQQPGPPGDGPPEAPSAPASADELASAVLDGELRGEAAAAAQRRPDVAARLAALRTVRSSLRDAPAPPPDPEARERAVAAALASFDEAGTSAPPAGRTAQRSGQVADLGSRRGARRQRVPRWLGAAAAAAVIGAGVASLAVFGSSSSDSDDAGDTATAALDESNEGGAEESSDAGGEAPEATTDSGADREAADAYGTAVDLGAFDSADALADEVGSVLARTESDGASSGAPAAGETASTLEGADSDLTAACPSALAAASAAPDATTVLRGRALVAGVAVDVWVVETPGSRRLVAVDGACGIVTDRELD